jgi:hypothetical protein
MRRNISSTTTINRARMGIKARISKWLRLTLDKNMIHKEIAQVVKMRRLRP